MNEDRLCAYSFPKGTYFYNGPFVRDEEQARAHIRATLQRTGGYTHAGEGKKSPSHWEPVQGEDHLEKLVASAEVWICPFRGSQAPDPA